MALEGRYDFRATELRLQEHWAALRIYEFDPTWSGPVFTVDTPPPTVSGKIHIGHVYSYTQADIILRYHRMRGEHVFYPFGFDDNGLPTERFTEQSRGITAREVGREAFIRACLELSAESEAQFERFWRRLGLSVDWRLRYSTIDDRSRRVAQRAFLDLYQRGHVERREAPTLWCPHCQTAVAQADVEDREGVPTSFSTIAFPTTDGREIRIGTTRPELLPACVAIFVHPDDPRYTGLIGATAITPLFGAPVPILANPEAQRDKGTGAVMCCTFGDVSDVRWWYTYALPLRIAITPDGRMNELAGPYAGQRITQARTHILEDLAAAGLILERVEITHSIGVHDRCGTPIEYLVAGQWFIGLLQHKERFLEAGRQITWYPDYMHARYESWVRGLTWDWNISRQRYYGVPFPIWYCEECDAVIVATPEQLPVDPTTTTPVTRCASCGSDTFRPETDVMDTWATSSETPRICATLADGLGLSEDAFADRYTPLSLRPNAHDIIRTWDFYTIVKSLFHTNRIPWNTVMIAGHAQDPSGKKLSKSRIKSAEDPTETIERFSADAVRYWTAGVRTGADTIVSEEAFRNGNKLITKLWNAAKLVLLHEPDASSNAALSGDSEDTETGTGTPLADRWLRSRLGRTVGRATAALDAYEFAAARGLVERFFWADFCDTYLELVKGRLYGNTPEAAGAANAVAARGSALATMRQTLLTLLKLFAPFLPHITEEIYLQAFKDEEGASSIHVARWPLEEAFPADPEAERVGESLLQVVEVIRRWKAERNLSVGAEVAALTISCPFEQVAALQSLEVDLRSITRARTIIVQQGTPDQIDVVITA